MGDRGKSCEDGWKEALESRIRVRGETLEHREYTNPFEDVHRKAKAFKDRAREANKNDAELRERRSVQEAKEILDKERE